MASVNNGEWWYTFSYDQELLWSLCLDKLQNVYVSVWIFNQLLRLPDEPDWQTSIIKLLCHVGITSKNTNAIICAGS